MLHFNPIGAGGGWISPHYFQMLISPLKKGYGGPKFLDFSWFIMNFQKIQKKCWFFTEFWGNLEASNIQKPRPIRVKNRHFWSK